MVEPIMYLAIGFLVSMLCGLMIVPLVHNRAVRLTIKRLEAATPLSMAEIQADKDQLRAEFAMSARRLEMNVEQLKNKTTSQLAELGKKSDAVNRLKMELGEKSATIFAIEAREKALQEQLHAAEAEIATKVQSLQDSERTLGDRQAEMAKLNAALSEQTAAVAAARAETEEVESRFANLERALATKSGEVADLGKRIKELEERIAAQDTTLAERDATISHQSGLLRTDAAPLATAISWEVFFGHRARAAVEAGGQVLYNPTNGSTYTGTFVQTQQVASSRLRAIENGRWLVQVAPTGFRAFITPDGKVEQRTGTRQRAVRHQAVELRTGFTWYTRFGDAPPRAVAVLLLAAAWALASRQIRRRPHPIGSPTLAQQPPVT